MNLAITKRPRVQKNIVLHIRRKLPEGKGKIFVAVGEIVTPETVLGEGSSPVGFRTYNLAQELGVSAKQAEKYLLRGVGKNIYEGELLAKKEGLFGLSKKLIIASGDGLIDFYDNKRGDLRIRMLSRRIKLLSGVYGIVDKVELGLGTVVIRTIATVIYGIQGSGKERDGVLKVIGNRESLISANQILPEMEKHIIVGGGLILEDAIVKSVGLGLGGIISGGINTRVYKTISGGKLGLIKRSWSDIGLSILITEGFGPAPIGQDIYACLKEHDESFVVIDGNKMRLILPTAEQNSMMSIQKAKLPDFGEIETKPEISVSPLKVSSKVRVISTPFLGIQGIVVKIDDSLTKLPSGVATYLVTVDTGLQKIRVPYSNIESIEA